ncbi:MAG TPA: Calx-beta domain-containing protein [Verrucomicrobiales bacterium]|nr:Calx-beta domain-containing protein [Verrucomicrobiales bacterium]
MKKLTFLVCLVLGAAVMPWWRQPEAKSPEPVRSKRVEDAGLPVREAWKESLRPGFLNRLSQETRELRQWAADFVEAAPGSRVDMLERGRALAGAHRSRMKELILADPRRALEEAMPMVLRQEVPDEITSLLEERVSARGFYGVLGRTNGEGKGGGIERIFVTSGGKRYQASVYGRRVRQRTTENTLIFGVALDGVLALHEDPLRPLEPGERLRTEEPVYNTCPVSGESVPAVSEEITPQSPAVEIGGEVHLLCSGGHIHALRDRLIAEEGGTGGPSKPPGAIPAPWSTGPKSVLYMRVTFPGQYTDPQPEKDAYDMMAQVNDFLMENSHFQVYLLTTVTPLLMMPKPEAWYAANDMEDSDNVLADARAAARAAGFDYSSYDLDAVRYNGASGGFNGQAFVGGRGAWLKTNSAGVACHEFGHNLGLWHANSWNTGGDSVIGSGLNSEYGNTFDTMGSANAGNHWFNAGHQHQLHWIPDENTTRVIRSGVYRIHQFDQGRIDPANRYLLTVRKDAQRDYWCEFRQKWTNNKWMMSGVPLNWSPWGDSAAANTPYGSNGGGQLLDTTPGSPDAREDSPVVIGQTFADAGAQTYITPVGKGGTVPESVDVVVNTGAFPGNAPPSLTLAASATAVAVNEPVTFTATAIDSNGDPLAYAWDWGDRTFGPNMAVASRAWSAEGIYTVRCEVSDMRGGTRSALTVVRVGSPALFTVRGRVLTGAGEPVAGVRVQNGLNNTGWRGCCTDSEGNYILSGLPGGPFSIGAAVYTHSLVRGFSDPLMVYSDITDADFTATARTAVSMSLPVNSCMEGGSGAVLRFTRVATINAGALDVRVFAGGSAAMSDVDFSPAETYDLTTYKFTIPSGQPSLDVAVTAFDDSLIEGPEQMTFYLVDGNGYIPSGVESATLSIVDNDTSLPVVSAEAVDDSAAEGSDGATLRFSRTGAVLNALTVTLTRSGAAAAGVDYTGVNTAVTIPAGQSFVDVPLTAVQDTDVEGSETAIFTLSTSAAWIRSPQQTSATVNLLDDDIPEVSITAPDSAASETGSDPAVFIVARTGSLTTPLNVDYVLGGTAHHGTDYQPLSGSVTIPAGQANASVVIVPVDDSIGEATQTVSVQLRSSVRYQTGAAFSASATITDNDVPHVMVTVSDGSCDEAGGTGKFRIQAYGSGPGGITVHYTMSGTALSGADYTALSGTASVPRGGFSDVTITPLQDSEMEDAESIELNLQPDAAYTLSPENTATLYLTDDDQQMVSVGAAAANYAENAGPVKFYFSRNGTATAPLTVHYTLTGTATAGGDYAVQSGTLTIPAGARGASLDVTLFDDSTAEGVESLSCTVVSSPGSYGTQGTPASVWLNDTETAGLPMVSFVDAASSQSESAGVVNIPVRLSFAAAREVRVDYALDAGIAFNGADYRAGSGTLVFAPGEMTQNIPVTLLEDNFVDPGETIGLRLWRATSARMGSQVIHTLTIADNDTAPGPVAGFAAATSSSGEGAGTPGQALVFLSAPQMVPCSVDWAVTGGTATVADVTGMNGTLTFLPGETAKPVPLGLVDDPAVETPETLTLSLSNATAPVHLTAQITHVLTILDNDAAVITLTTQDSAAAEEGADPAQITVTRTSPNPAGALTVKLTIGGTATAGSDYTALTEVTIPAGETSVTFPLTPLDDAVLDPGETVVISVAPSPLYVVGNPSSSTIAIVDNETGISIAATDADAAEPSETGTFTLTRTGPAAGELAVALSAGGSAPAGDFEALPSSVLFAAGQTTLAVKVKPVDDSTPEPDRTVTLTIVPGAGYLIGTPSATVTIHDDDSNNAPQIALHSPAGGSAFIPGGPGLVLNATVTDDGRPLSSGGLTTSWTMISGPGTVTFGDSAAAKTTALFSAPGSYLLKLTAEDSELTASTNVSVFVLSDTLTGVSVGTPGTLSGLAGSGASWALTGEGSGIGNATADGFYFAHRPMSGDFTIVARVASINPANAGISARCGVMVRGSLAAGAKHAAMTAAPGRLAFVWRTADGGTGVSSANGVPGAVPRYLRLQRTGNLFSAAESTDGISWDAHGSAQTVVMADPVYAGLAVTSASTTASVTAAFEDFQITRAGNTGPLVDAGPPISSGLNALLAGTVTDDSGVPSVYWQKVSGPGDVSFPPAATGSALFETPGTYSLRLLANDGLVTTFDDTVAHVTTPYGEWSTLHFGGNAGNPLISGPRADPENDGLENLVEYALGSDPMLPDNGAVPVCARDGEALRMTWRESTSATDVVIEPQWSGDMAAWESTGLTVEVLNTGPGWTEKRATLNTSGRPHAGVRLSVTLE